MDWHQRARVIIPFPSTSTARRQRRRQRRQQGHSRQRSDRKSRGTRKNGSAGWYRADQGPYRDLSSSEAEEDDELAQGGGRGGGEYPPRPARDGLKSRMLGSRKRDQRMRVMPGAFVAAGGEGSDGEDLESGGAVSVGDTSGSEAGGSESASDSEGGQGSSEGGGKVQEEEEQGTLPLLRNTVPPPRSRPLRPNSGTASPSTGGQGTSSDVTAAVGKLRRRRRPIRLEIICTPAQHRSGRGLLDQMRTLWASWVVRVIDDDDDDDDDGGDAGEEVDTDGNKKFDGWGESGVGDVTSAPSGADDVWEKAKGWNVFFGGDTGFRYAGALDGERDMYICPAFQDIAHQYGPMDLCLLPISTGSSLSFLRNIFGLSLHHYSLTSAQHSNAWDAIQIAKLMQAKRTVAIHHSTFSPEDEARGCVYEFVNTAKEEGVPQDWEEDGCFVVADIGQVLEIP
ncbi:hypothetical protein QFC22_004596 [Naganishia vaughanmartiniae]|uniref:Uncharacterized protein n=1 Tax=Naganishia vaughanmartiniae TaxID=1424756 RepID=A0ACC2WZJ6_9TREE|nr:hypothetical protein QFC22_004596 [Naganishia vaughanmartiniae]